MKTRKFCPHCGGPVVRSKTLGYTFQCHACECNFAAWYAGLPQDMQRKVMDYYRKQKSL